MSSIQAWIAANNLNSTLVIEGRELQGAPAIIDYLGKKTLTLTSQETFDLYHLLKREITTDTTLLASLVNNLFKDPKTAFCKAVEENQIDDAKELFNSLDNATLKELIDGQIFEAINTTANEKTIDYIADEFISKVKERLAPPSGGFEIDDFATSSAYNAYFKSTFEKLEQMWVNSAPEENRAEALRRIKECRQTNSTRLDLSNLKLSKLPPFLLRNLNSLTDLYLYNNQLQSVTIPDTLIALTSLHLSNNQLQSVTIPDTLTALTYLTLSYNQLQSVTIPATLIALERLDLSNNQLQSVTIPDTLLALTSLYLSNNQLQSVTIPAALIALERLYLFNNQLQSVTIPDTLIALKSLCLEQNRLQSVTIPNTLRALTYLYLYNNQLQSVTIPDTLTALKELYLSKNELQSVTIPDTLIALERLDLSKNQLPSVTIPDNLIALKELYLSNNQLQSVTIPDTLIALKKLYLNHNQLQSVTIPATLTALRELNLNHNQPLQSLPLTLQNCINLTHIDCDRALRQQADAILDHLQRQRMNRGAASLPEKLALWNAYSGKKEALSFFNSPDGQEIETLNNQKKGILYEWMTRLEVTKEFEKNQKELTAIVIDILASLNPKAKNYDKNFVESFYVELLPNLERCSDRASETLNIIYASWAIHHLPKKATEKEKVELLIKAAKAFALNKAIAIKLGSQSRQEENVEVHLFYKTLFKDEILTAVKSYTYAGMGDRRNNPKGSRITEQELRTYINNNFWDELTDLIPFKNLLLANDLYRDEYSTYLQEVVEPAKEAAKTSINREYDQQRIEIKTLADQKKLMILCAKKILDPTLEVKDNWWLSS